MLFILFPTVNGLRLATQGCGRVPVVAGASVVSKDSYLLYTCMRGFAFNGTYERVRHVSCDEVDIPPCVPIRCQLPAESPPNSLKIDYPQELAYHATFRYTCNEGSSADGVAGGPDYIEVVCSDFGDLRFDSLMTSACRNVSCGEPPVKAHATASDGLNQVSFGKAAIYTCDQGFSGPNGQTLAVPCLSDGQFEQGLECEALRCEDPPIVENTRALFSSPIRLGDRVHYVCDLGTHANVSRLVINATSFDLVCAMTFARPEYQGLGVVCTYSPVVSKL